MGLIFSIEYLSFSIHYLLEEVFNHMYIVDAQDAGASPPGSAPHLQWGQVGDQNLGMSTKNDILDLFISMVVYISIKIKHFKPYITF